MEGTTSARDLAAYQDNLESPRAVLDLEAAVLGSLHNAVESTDRTAGVGRAEAVEIEIGEHSLGKDDPEMEADASHSVSNSSWSAKCRRLRLVLGKYEAVIRRKATEFSTRFCAFKENFVLTSELISSHKETKQNSGLTYP